jgi:RNA polymerase sigma factor (TIGR02999 family)
LASSDSSSPETHWTRSSEYDDLTKTIYHDLKKIAGVRMVNERPNQTLQTTALVHEAWLRLGGDEHPTWGSRAHFMSAAAEAMRRILIDRARRRKAKRHGGGLHRVDMDAESQQIENQIVVDSDDDTLLALHESLDMLAEVNPETADLVKLKYFAGMTIAEVAETLGISKRTADRRLTFARAWLGREMNRS